MALKKSKLYSSTRKAKAIEYEEYLKRIAELAKRVAVCHGEETPEHIDTPRRRAIYSNLSNNEELAIKIDHAIRGSARRMAWHPSTRASDQAGAVLGAS